MNVEYRSLTKAERAKAKIVAWPCQTEQPWSAKKWIGAEPCSCGCGGTGFMLPFQPTGDGYLKVRGGGRTQVRLSVRLG